MTTTWLKPVSATASSFYEGYPPSKAIDGDFLTSWISIENDPSGDWIQFDLGEEKSIDNINIMIWGEGLSEVVDIQTSTDGITWNTLATDIEINETTIEVPFDEVTTRYVKLVIKSHPNTFAEIAELGVHACESKAIFRVTEFTAPSSCKAPCKIDIHIKWKNVGTTSGSFVPKFTVGSDIYSASEQTLAPDATYTLNYAANITSAGTYEICPYPNE